jgi:hypothetical protein
LTFDFRIAVLGFSSRILQENEDTAVFKLKRYTIEESKLERKPVLLLTPDS